MIFKPVHSHSWFDHSSCVTVDGSASSGPKVITPEYIWITAKPFLWFSFGLWCWVIRRLLLKFSFFPLVSLIYFFLFHIHLIVLLSVWVTRVRIKLYIKSSDQCLQMDMWRGVFAQALTQRVIKQFTGYILVEGNHCKAALHDYAVDTQKASRTGI